MTTTKTSIDTTFMSYSTGLFTKISANGGTHDGGWVSMSVAIDNCEKIGKQIFRIKDRSHFDMVMQYKLQNHEMKEHKIWAGLTAKTRM